ncbi:NADH-quinone oxidoreductase subunit J [Planctomycetota bacterium]
MLTIFAANTFEVIKDASASDWVFFALATVAMMSAFMVAYCKNVIHSAFSLLLSLCCVAGLYAYLSADFLVAVQIMVYVGGVLVLILFGTLLTGRPVAGREKENSLLHTIMGLGVFGFVLLMLMKVMRDTDWRLRLMRDLQPGEEIPLGPYQETTHSLAQLLLTDYLLPFEIISVLLIGALIGAVLVSRSSEEK